MHDPFQTLGLPRRFDLDQAELHSRYIRASADNHPDRHADPVAQAQAAERAAQINHAYAVLKDPERRADALLTLLGGPGKTDDRSLPPDLLMDMMQTREQLEEAVAEDNRPELERLRTWANEQRQKHLDKINTLFAANATPPPEDAKAIRLELNTLRYIERMLEQMPA